MSPIFDQKPEDPHRSELKRSEAKFRSIFEESRDGLIILSAEGRFIEANAAALAMFGCPDLGAFLQCTPADYSPPEQPCGRSSAELARGHIRAALSGQTVRFEWIHRRGDDGREFPCDITLSPIEFDGQAAVLASAEDLTEKKKTEEAARQSEQLFRLAFDYSPLGACMVDLQGNIFKTNARLAEMFGYSRKDLEKMTVDDLAIEEDVNISAEVMGNAIEGREETTRFDKRFYHRDGRIIHAEVSTSLVRDAAGHPQYFISQLQDITRRKMAEAALTKAEEDYRLRTETIKDVIWVFDPSTQLFLYVSPSCLKLFGYTPEELYDKKVTETVLRRPDQTEQVEKLIREGMESFLSGKIRDSEFLSADIDHTQKDGSIFHVEIVYRFMRNTDTGRVEVLGTTRDITERQLARAVLRQREMELEEARNRYQLLLENSTDVVVQLNNDDTIAWISPSVTSLLGWRPEQMVGRALEDYVHPDDRNHLHPVQINLPLGMSGQVELRLRTPAVGWRWVSSSMRPIFDKQGIVTGRVAGLRDIQAEVMSRGTLEAERTRLRATIDSLLDPHIMLRPIRDSRGKIADFVFAEVNAAACAHDNIERDQLVGRSLLSLLPNHRSSGLFDMYCETIETGHPLVLSNFAYRDEMQNGEERRLNLSATKVGEALSLTWRDVTEK